MYSDTKKIIEDLISDEYRRVSNRKKTEYVDGRAKGILKVAVLVKKYWPDMDTLDAKVDTLLEKAGAINSPTAEGFTRSLTRIQQIMWLVSGDVLTFEFPTHKQLYLIKNIEEKTDTEFLGITRQDASDFIEKHQRN